MKKADPVLNYEEFPHLCYDVVKIEKAEMFEKTFPLAELEEKLKAAHGKAETIVQLAQDEAKKLQEKTVQETEAKVKQVQREAEQEIESSRNKLLQEIRSHAAALTIASAEKFLKKTLDDTDKIINGISESAT